MTARWRLRSVPSKRIETRPLSLERKIRPVSWVKWGQLLPKVGAITLPPPPAAGIETRSIAVPGAEGPPSTRRGRITSYNVCYTKLLRCGSSAMARFTNSRRITYWANNFDLIAGAVERVAGWCLRHHLRQLQAFLT